MPPASRTDQAPTPLARGLETTTVATSSLDLYPGNPRRGDVDAIKKSLEVNGQYRPLVVSRRTRQVLAGNHTLTAARELGWTEIAVVLLDVDDEQARRIVLVDNRTADLAENDSAALLGLLDSLDGLDGTGYDERAIDELLDELEPPPLEEDDVPPPPAEPRTEPGQVLALGGHLVACGDARDPDLYKALLRDEAARILWTDPPYGVDYEGKTRAKLRLAGDGPEGLGELLRDSFAQIDRALAPGAPLYIAHPAGAQSFAFTDAFRSQSWLLRQTLIWRKPSLVMGRSRLPLPARADPLRLQARRGPPRPRRGGLVRGQPPVHGARGRPPRRLPRAPDDQAARAGRDSSAQLLATRGDRARPLRGVGLDARRLSSAGSARAVDRDRPALLRRDRRPVRAVDGHARRGALMARPTKATPQRRERIVKAVAAGNYIEASARSAGVHPSTVYRWIERGEREAEGIYHDFAEEVRRAEAEAEVHAVAIIRRAMAGDWRAALSYLERRHPAGWRRRETRELTGPGGGAIRTEHSLDLSKLTEAELDLLEELNERASREDRD